MSQHPYYQRVWLIARYERGPLAPYLGAFAAFLERKGYSYSTGQLYIREAGRFSCWLGRERVDLAELDEEAIQTYLRVRRRGIRSPVKSGPCLQLLDYLRQARIARSPPAEPATPRARCLRDYREHLRRNQGLAEETIRRRTRIVGGFLARCFGDGEELDFARLRPKDVVDHILGRSRRCAPVTVEGDVSALRSFFRFLEFRGEAAADLLASVPVIHSWKRTSLPVSLTPGQVDLLLDQCDCRTAVGRRDLAMLLLLVRLGLRAIEVRRLTLDDVDWAAASIAVEGKNGQCNRLPLPKDAGEALAAYVRWGRPPCPSRCVFIRAAAPYRPFASSCAVAHAVRRALKRAGLEPPRRGSHLLRHTCATGMLAQGASLPEIGQILRHRRTETTAIYAKLDLKELRPLVPPWLEGG